MLTYILRLLDERRLRAVVRPPSECHELGADGAVDPGAIQVAFGAEPWVRLGFADTAPMLHQLVNAECVELPEPT